MKTVANTRGEILVRERERKNKGNFLLISN